MSLTLPQNPLNYNPGIESISPNQKFSERPWYAKKYHTDAPMSGYTKDENPKVSIWGKLKGLDPDFSQEQIKELKDFIDESGALGYHIERRLNDQKKKDYIA
ncbi:hypothetical protein [Campylobacter pinnipediorum]|uniref:hypothetical protein n=1 Tax=Campylobacter pinnipediorum TaxID=1965231 RepID=UPI0009955C7C|nr:hypothetical protein [Campylobacter pinnipediorum]